MKLVNKKTSSRTKVTANNLLQNAKNNNSTRTKRQSSPSSSLSSTTEEEEFMIMNEEKEEEEIQHQTTRQVYINLPKAKAGKKALKNTAVSDIRSLANKLKTRMSNLAKKVTSSVAHSSAAAAAPLSQPISTEVVSIQPTTTCSANLAPLSPAMTNSTKLATPPPVTTTCAPPLSPPPFNTEVVISAPPSPTLSVSKAHSLSIDTLSARTFTNTSDSPLSPPLESLLESPTELKKPQQMPLPDTPVSLTGNSTLLPPAGHWSNTAAYKPRLNSMKVLNTYLFSLSASQEVQELSIQDGAIHMTFNDSEKELGESVMDQWTEQQKQARTVSTFIEYLVHDPDECNTLYQDQQEQVATSHNVNRERVQQQVNNKQNQPNKASRSNSSSSSSSSSSRRPGRPSKNPLLENEKDKTDQLKMKQKQKAIRKRQSSISSSSTQDSSLASSSSTSASSQYTINTTTQATFGRMRKPNQKGQDVISCICNYSQEEFGRMVQCDDCKHWLHMECLDLTPYSLHYSFRCPPCAIIYQDTNKDDNKVTSALTWRYEAKVNSASLAAVAFGGSAAASVYEEEEEEEGEKSDSEVESESDSEIEVSSMTEFDVNTIMEEEEEEDEEEEEEEDEFKIAEELAKQAMEIDVEYMATAPPSPTTTHSTYSDFSSEVSTPQVSPLEDFWVTSATTTAIFNTELPSAVCSKEDIFPNVNPFIFY